MLRSGAALAGIRNECAPCFVLINSHTSLQSESFLFDLFSRTERVPVMTIRARINFVTHKKKTNSVEIDSTQVWSVSVH